MRTTFMVQTFGIHRKRLRPGARDVAPTENGALKRAEVIVKRMPGTAALRIVADDETGELESATILGQFGEVPEDFAEIVGQLAKLFSAYTVGRGDQKLGRLGIGYMS